MTKKKKQQMGMIITLCIVLCGLGIGYFLAAKKQQQKEDEAKESEITLYSLKEDDITTLHYKNGTADITFVKEDKSWKLKDDKAFPVNQSKVKNMVADVAKMTAKRLVAKDCDDMTDYELDSPQLVIELSTKSGDTKKLSYGLETAAAGGCYAYMDQEKDVYVVASNVTSDFEYTRNQLMKVPDAPDIDSDRVNVYQVKTAKGESFTAKKVTQKASDDSKDTSEDTKSWSIKKSSGKVTDYDYTAMDNAEAVLEDLSVSEGVCYQATTADKKKYGLLTPKDTITIKYDTVSAEDTSESEDTKKTHHVYTLLVGKENKSTGDFYVSIKGEKGIYLMSSDTIKTLVSELL